MRGSEPQSYADPQIMAMRMGVAYRFRITCRRFEMDVRPLSVHENLLIAGRVAERLAALPPSQRNQLGEHTILAMETLIMASTSDVDSNDPKITDTVLQLATPAELHHLFKQYSAACAKVDPSLDEMPAVELEGLVEALKKSPEDALGYQLTELSFTQLANVCQKLIRESKLADKSSGGSPIPL